LEHNGGLKVEHQEVYKETENPRGRVGLVEME